MSRFRQFLDLLKREREIVDINEEVDPTLEIAEIHRKTIENEGPALFFRNVKGSSFPVVTNLFGTMRRIDLAFGGRPEKVIEKACSLIQSQSPLSLQTLWQSRSLFRLGCTKKRKSPLLDNEISPADLEKLPLLTSWPLDGGPFLTLPLVYTEPPGGGSPNLGIYRIQRFNKTEAGLHFQIAKGGGFHYHLAEKREQDLPVTIFLGGSPELILAAMTPLPENISELLFASLISGEKIGTIEKNGQTLLADSEFALIGKARPHVRRKEGPFGDHYGYYSLAHDFPVFECEKIYHRKGAIYPATVVGKPRQEDYFLGNYLQKLMLPLIKLLIPSLNDFWSYGEGGFHTVAGALVKERYEGEAMTTAFRLLGEGQLALTKSLLITDQKINLTHFNDLLQHILERFSPEKDLHIFSPMALDTLDYTGPTLNRGSKMVWLGLGEKKRELPKNFQGKPPQSLRKIIPYLPGCLVMEGKGEINFESLLDQSCFEKWPLLILVDDAEKMVQSEMNFIWTLFTRFEPARDLYAKKTKVVNNHLAYELPLLIDARMKPGYPPQVD